MNTNSFYSMFTMFNFFDLFFLAFLILSVYAGFKCGFIAAVFYIVSGFVSFWSAHHFAPEPFLNFYLIFIITFAAMITVWMIMKHFMQNIVLGIVDRIAGLLIGFIMAFVIFGLMVLPFTLVAHKMVKKQVKSSFTSSYVIPFIQKNVLIQYGKFTVDDIKNIFPVPKKNNYKLFLKKFISDEEEIKKKIKDTEEKQNNE